MSISTKTAQKKAPSDKSVFKKQVNNKNSLNKQNSPAQDILNLHQTIGNQAVQRLFESGFIQGKLTVGEPNDKYEQEADRVADEVMRMPEPQVQRQSEEDEEEEMIQTKPVGEQITPLVQRQVEPEEEEEETIQTKSEGQTPQVTSSLESRINALQGGGQPLSKETRGFFEPRFGQDFSRVRIHNDSNAHHLARSINARAFTKGSDVVFGGGEYSPESSGGKRLLGHELTHVVQQNRKKINRLVIQKKENNTGLPDNLKGGIESLSGHSMDDVKVHYNSSEPAQLNAHAFAKGSDIHLASGAEQHLPHEAWHVVQQKQGKVQPTKQLKGKVNVNDDEGLEREADVMGDRALQMKNVNNRKVRRNNKSTSVIQQRKNKLSNSLEEANYREQSWIRPLYKYTKKPNFVGRIFFKTKSYQLEEYDSNLLKKLAKLYSSYAKKNMGISGKIIGYFDPRISIKPSNKRLSFLRAKSVEMDLFKYLTRETGLSAFFIDISINGSNTGQREKKNIKKYAEGNVLAPMRRADIYLSGNALKIHKNDNKIKEKKSSKFMKQKTVLDRWIPIAEKGDIKTIKAFCAVIIGAIKGDSYDAVFSSLLGLYKIKPPWWNNRSNYRSSGRSKKRNQLIAKVTLLIRDFREYVYFWNVHMSSKKSTLRKYLRERKKRPPNHILLKKYQTSIGYFLYIRSEVEKSAIALFKSIQK